METIYWIFCLAGVTLLGGLLWRGSGRRRRSAFGEARRHRPSELVLTEPIPESQLRQWQTELHDDSQAVEARIDDRLQILDFLVIEADREDERLQTLLKPYHAPAELTAAEVQRARQLHYAGLTIREISRRLGCSSEAVRASLIEGTGPQTRAA